MVHIQPFAVEQWMDKYESQAKFNLAETCSASISIEELISLSGQKDVVPLDLSRKLDYGAIRGSEKLRKNIAALYATEGSPSLGPKNVLVTPGAIMANFLVLYSLVTSGDHVICVYPTYPQLYTLPKTFGASVSCWKYRAKKGSRLDINDLKDLIKDDTKLIILNNPNNPTGATMSCSLLEEVVDLAKAHNITVLSDEVYRPLFHSSKSGEESSPSILSLGYAKTISTGSLSKAYSLAGIRVGWIASNDSAIIEDCFRARDYTTISVSHLDDQIATFALSPEVAPRILDRNLKLASTNVNILAKTVEELDGFLSWKKPTAGTTAFIKLCIKDERSEDAKKWEIVLPSQEKAVDDVKFCKSLVEQTGVMICPGSRCFGEEKRFRGYVRIGYACETEVLKQGLEMLKNFVRENGYWK
ncbi:MAG: hypothetical protein M1823_000145 [Watsoniomyces obsoletus]|nr:MAG: hypothetical protein M1823_000145 [Watsoniomyces obsoletus]